MASTIQHAKITGFPTYLPATTTADNYHVVFQNNRHRVYALAFWMTDNEIDAEELMGNVFRRAFAHSPEPTSEAIDRALIAEVRESMPLGILTLNEEACEQSLSIRFNMKRVHLERAVVQLPATERLIYLMHDGEGYDHARIARHLGITEEESHYGLHQARLCIRRLVATMK